MDRDGARGTHDSQGRPSPVRRALWPLAAAAVIGLAAIGGAAMWRRTPAPALAFQQRDWILISDFDNLTGDPVFDRSLHVALEVGVGQSHHVNVFARHSVQATLQRMKQPAGERLTEVVASEVAVREGVRAVLAGSIARVGDTYTLSARLIEPHSRATVLAESVEVTGREHVLEGLNDLALRIRRRLGESLASISQNSLPLPRATTGSVEALKLYADSLLLLNRHEAPSNSLLREALRIDPDFALAHAELGRRYYLKPDRGTRLEAEREIAMALGSLDRLSPRERLWIQAMADDARGERRKAVDGYRAYLVEYPDDPRGWYRLGWTYMAGLREYDRARDAFSRTIAISPRDAGAHLNLATSYSGLRQYDGAADMYGKAFALNPNLFFGEYVNHEYGFTLLHLGRIDEATSAFTRMKQQSDSTKRARGHRSMALLEMYRGRYGPAFAELREAILINQATGSAISEFRDRLILARALDAAGRSAQARREIAAVERLEAALTLSPEWLRALVKVQARRGRAAEARRLTAQMTARAADATADSATNRAVDFDQAEIEQALAECALAEGKVDEAIGRLEAAHRAQPDPDRLESLAAAFAAAGKLDLAAARYEALIANPPLGYETQEDWFRAHVTLGGIYERLNRPGEARRMYARLIALWKDGDAGLVALQRARTRLEALASNSNPYPTSKSRIPNPK